MCAQRTALLRITHGSPSRREASCNHSRKEWSHASRPCVRASFLPTMAKNSFRDARTPHCGDAHNAPLNPAPAPHICAYLRLRRKSECGALLCCDCAAERKPAVSRRRTRGFSLKLTKIFRVSSRKICELRFYAPFTLPTSVLSRRLSESARTGCSLFIRR